MSLIFLLGGDILSKINPGSNFHEDNDTQTARPGGLQDTNIIEPIMDGKSKLHCPLCDGIFSSREDYISHALSKHQPAELNCDKKGCTSE
jgi:uncharacterized C2H2 Zn-finger protein